MLVVFIFGCLIPATIRVIQQFKYQLIAAVLAIFGLRMALGAYVATMTKGLQANSEALLEWCRHRWTWVCLKIGYPENNTGLSPLFLWNYYAVAIPFLDTAIWKNVYILFLFLEGHKSHFQTDAQLKKWAKTQSFERLIGVAPPGCAAAETCRNCGQRWRQSEAEKPKKSDQRGTSVIPKLLTLLIVPAHHGIHRISIGWSIHHGFNWVKWSPGSRTLDPILGWLLQGNMDMSTHISPISDSFLLIRCNSYT